MRTVMVHEHVTGGGLAGQALPRSWAVEGRAIRRAIATDFAAVPGVRVLMTLDPRLPDEPGPWTIARVKSAAVIPRLAAQVDHTALIAPETDGVLGDLARAIPNNLGPFPETIDLAADKLKLATFLIGLGVPTPRSVAVQPHLGLPLHFSYPAVLKPIDGAGAVETWLIKSPSDGNIQKFSREWGLLQPFVPGESRSATFIAEPGRTARLIGVGRQAIDREAGRFAYHGGSLIDEPLPLGHPARRAVAALDNLRGWIGVDYIQDPATGSATVIEINPRPTTSCVGLVAAIGPGRLASLWLDAKASDFPVDDLSPLARPMKPLMFRADGMLAPAEHEAGTLS